jgi:hypothetical protein
MTAQISHQQQQVHSRQDFRLLLKTLENADFTEEGTEFVRRAFSSGIFWREFSAEEILRLSSLAQQHGLIDKGLEILSWLNERRPENEEGWQAHLDLLQLLGRCQEQTVLLARLSRYLPAERFVELKNRYTSTGESEDKTDIETPLIDPFLKLRRDEEDIALYMRLFRGREEVFARQWADKEQEKQGYMPVQRPLLTGDVREHLLGRKTYGIYLLTSDEKVWTGVIDVDLVARLRNREEARKERDGIRREAVYLYKRIIELSENAGLACICEISGGKGYHYWFPATSPVDAGIMKKALQVLVRDLAADVKCFSLEVFPKQDSLKGKGYGNLVKLPLGVHRGSGKKSGFVPVPKDKPEQQFSLLRAIKPSLPENFRALVERQAKAAVIVHPRQSKWAAEYPELAALSVRCAPLGQIISVLRTARDLSLREEKVLLGVLAHLPRGRLLLHHLFSRLSEYNRPLLDYKISRIRGSVLGCKRIHSLLDGRTGDLPCVFENGSYPHPLLHVPDFDGGNEQVSERVTNLQDALLSLKTAIEQIQRFL